MTDIEALSAILSRTLRPEKAARFLSLTDNAKGRAKLLASLGRQFAEGIRDDAKIPGDYGAAWDRPCLAFHRSLSFGAPFPSVREAHEQLALRDEWLIVLQDGSTAIYRPDSKWDEETMLK